MNSISVTALRSVSFRILFVSSFVPVLKVLLMSSLCLIFALPRINILDSRARYAMSKLIYYIFLPAFIFINLGEAISLEKLREWWFIPVNVCLASIFGCLTGFVVSKISGTPPEFRKLVSVMVGIGNQGNLPIVLITAICSDSGNPFGDEGTCTTSGEAYVSLGMWTAALIMWGGVYNYLSFPKECLPGHIILNEPINSADNFENVPNLKIHLDYGEYPKDYGDTQNEISNFLLNQNQVIDNFKSIPNSFINSLKWFFNFFKLFGIFRPPIIAAFVSMLCGIIPTLDSIFFDDDGFFNFLTDVITTLSEAFIPCILFVLGGNMAKGAVISKMPQKTIWNIVLARQILLPLVGLMVVYFADYFHFIPDDSMFKFVLMLQHTMPASIELSTCCSLRGFGEKEASAVLFFQYSVAVITMTCYIMIYLYILFD